MSAPLALSSAVAYGAGDFAGGLAARRTSVLPVTVVAQAAGLAALLPVALLVPGEISVAALGIGALAGVCGMAGLLLYLRGLAAGPMGLVAPLSSVVGAALPLLAGVLAGERPDGVAWLALLVALVAIVLASVGSRGDAAAGAGLTYGIGAGVGFGLFFVAIAATPDGAGLWPLVSGRVVSVSLLVAFLVRRAPAAGPRVLKATFTTSDALKVAFRTLRDRAPAGFRLMVLCGLLDTAANVLFLLATRTGALSVAGVLVSLYPVVVVLLARIVLRERLSGLQITGVGLALTASALLASAG